MDKENPSDNYGRIFFIIVRLKGLEPPRLSAPDPKSGAATNYATAASLLYHSKCYQVGVCCAYRRCTFLE